MGALLAGPKGVPAPHPAPSTPPSHSEHRGAQNPALPHTYRGAGGHPIISAAGVCVCVCPLSPRGDTHPAPGRGGPRAAGRGAGGSASAWCPRGGQPHGAHRCPGPGGQEGIAAGGSARLRGPPKPAAAAAPAALSRFIAAGAELAAARPPPPPAAEPAPARPPGGEEGGGSAVRGEPVV